MQRKKRKEGGRLLFCDNGANDGILNLIMIKDFICYLTTNSSEGILDEQGRFSIQRNTLTTDRDVF